MMIPARCLILICVFLLSRCQSSEFIPSFRIPAIDGYQVALIGNKGSSIWLVITQQDSTIFNEELDSDNINMLVSDFNWEPDGEAFAIKTRFYDGGNSTVKIRVYHLGSHTVKSITTQQSLQQYEWIHFDFDGFSMRENLQEYIWADGIYIYRDNNKTPNLGPEMNR